MIPDDISGFREALLEQAENRVLILKREADEEIAEMVASRRMEAEQAVHRLRVSQQNRLKEGLRSNRRRAEEDMMLIRAGILRHLAEALEERVGALLRDLRRSESYKDVMAVLMDEVKASLGPSTVILVEEGDAAALKFLRNVKDVREELRDTWGGFVLLDERTSRVIDNTFHARWKRLLPVLMREFETRLPEMPNFGREAAGRRKDGF